MRTSCIMILLWFMHNIPYVLAANKLPLKKVQKFYVSILYFLKVLTFGVRSWWDQDINRFFFISKDWILDFLFNDRKFYQLSYITRTHYVPIPNCVFIVHLEKKVRKFYVPIPNCVFIVNFFFRVSTYGVCFWWYLIKPRY